ncbi:PilX N-terminal domain-containing pilus assembly protein [Pseudomonas sp. LS1212]|uniref:pilus assembly PilX family protein n=1 Tax=Pseudomonas sp. LS1212 TaxID=2972478 RepID=UPI00215D1782|nr:PilX N-terminal domain-containing pilus assembly protein [Pseudomonas sp. LS1212]UVJ43355.1 PilX N-terminal domain-containing pilus assembly protein [Pseudomonas sp. LS1212]
MKITEGSLHQAQKGMALVVSLIFLLLLTLIGVSSMQNATLQEKMAGSVKLRNESFQIAEAALRAGETAVQSAGFNLPVCRYCLPPPESTRVIAAGVYAGSGQSSGVAWLAADKGFYMIQNIGVTNMAANLPAGAVATLYRVTAVGLRGHSRSVLESVYAKY